MNPTSSLSNPQSRMQLEATLCWDQQSLPLCALVDSGADDSFIDSNLAAQAGILSEPLTNPLDASALNGELPAHATHRTRPHNSFSLATTVSSSTFI